MWLTLTIIFIIIVTFKNSFSSREKKEKHKSIIVVPVKGKKYVYIKHRKMGYLYKKDTCPVDSRYHAEVLFRNGGIDKNLSFSKKKRTKLRIIRKNGKSFVKFYDGTFLCKSRRDFYASKEKRKIHLFNNF